MFDVGWRSEGGVSGPEEVVDCHRLEPQLCFETDGDIVREVCKERSISIEFARLGHL